MPDTWWSFCTSLTKGGMMPFCDIKSGYNMVFHVVVCHSCDLYPSVSLHLFFTCLSLQSQGTESILSVDLSNLSFHINYLHTHFYDTWCFFCRCGFPVKKPVLGYMLIYLVSVSVFLMLKHACFYSQNFFHYALDIFKKDKTRLWEVECLNILNIA